MTADVTRPLRELADWVTLQIEPGQTATASFVVTPDALRYYDRAMRCRVDPGKAEAIVGPNAADGMVAGFTVRP
jgi:beta-glucosidase